MRVTNLMISQNLLYNLNQIQQNLSSSQNEISTGKVLNKPSDNPLAVSQDMADSTAIAQGQSYVSNIQSGTTWLNSTTTVLQSMTSTLQSIRDVALQALNTPAQTPTATTGLQQEVAQLMDNLSQLSDAKQGTSYLLGGFATDSKVSQYMTTTQLTTNATAASQTSPVVNSGGTISIIGSLGSKQVSVPNNSTLQQLQSAINAVQTDTGVTASLPVGGAGYQLVLQPQQAGSAFGMSGPGVTLAAGGTLGVTTAQTNPPPAGSNGSIQYAVSASSKQQVNVTAGQIFNQIPSGGTQSLQSTLQSILNDIGSPAALQKDLGNLDANTSQLIQTNSEVGARTDQMQTMLTQTNQYISNMQNQQASLENVNMAQALTGYQNELATYQAALKVGSKILLPTLAQYLP